MSTCIPLESIVCVAAGGGIITMSAYGSPDPVLCSGVSFNVFLLEFSHKIFYASVLLGSGDIRCALCSVLFGSV